MERNICQTCLSKDRRLIPQKSIKNLLQETLNVELNRNQGICWECHHIIAKYCKFRLQVRKAQVLLKCMGKKAPCLSKLSSTTKDYFDYQFAFNTDPLTDELDINTDVKEKDATDSHEDVGDESENDENEPLEETKPNLAVEVNVAMRKANIPVCNSFDDDTIDSLEYESDTDIGDCSESANSNSEADVSAVNVKRVKKERDNNFMNNRSKIKKIKEEPQTSMTDLQSKFFIVMFSEEEMQKLREEKRNHPNFKKIPFKCDSCVLGFTRQDKLDEHMEKKHNQKHIYTCDICLLRFSHKHPLARHIATHYTRYRCRLCPYQATEMWCALNHCRSKHRTDYEGRIHCPECGEETRNQEDLSEHIKTQHALYCNECGQTFKGKHTLRTHKIRIHGQKRDFSCEICLKTFKTKSRLESHTFAHNPAAAKKLAYCATCNIQYKNIYVYRNHLRSSAKHAERSYSCPECNKKFASKEYWTKHYNFYHLRKSKFHCDSCRKMFISKWRLKVHKQIQHGLTRPRNHPCDICGKEFFTPAALRSHRLTHSAARSFMCEDCGDTFKQRAALYTHSRRVHRHK